MRSADLFTCLVAVFLDGSFSLSRVMLAVVHASQATNASGIKFVTLPKRIQGDALLC